MDPETALVNAFVIPAKRARFIGFLRTTKRRSKVLATLYHCNNLDLRFCVEIAPSDQVAATIAALLFKRGAPPQCHLISTNRALDGRDLPLVEALPQIIGFGEGTLVSCIPSRLAYFEGEGPNNRYILEKSAA